MSRGTSKSSVSRRFVAKTTAQLRAWQSAPLDGLDLVALLLDGVHIGEHCLIVALGIAADGQKHALGLWEGATENAVLPRPPIRVSPCVVNRFARQPSDSVSSATSDEPGSGIESSPRCFVPRCSPARGAPDAIALQAELPPHRTDGALSGGCRLIPLMETFWRRLASRWRLTCPRP